VGDVPRVLITTDYLRPGDEVDDLLRRAGHDTVHLPLRGRRDVAELVGALRGVEAALVANEPLTAGVLRQATSLRVVVRTGAGYDSVDVAAAARLGITVSNLPGINANAVAEYTLALLLGAARGLVRSAAGVAAGGWPREAGYELRGATLGLIGYGAAARAVVPLAQAFGTTILCMTGVPAREATPGVRFVGLDELLATADYVSIHTALTDRSRGLLDAAAFARMKPTAVLVNTARGPIVDGDALERALREGWIGAAALDVTDPEPLPADHPLLDAPNLTIVPHVGSATHATREAMAALAVDNLLAALAGERMPHCVNPEVYG
jgi:phosphoglycerate dehydrogenase-like enzyme